MKFDVRPILKAIALCIALVCLYHLFHTPKSIWHYRMTVTVETPEGFKTGSSVREVELYREPSILPDQGGTIRIVKSGEAVIVDLGKRGVLFALLQNANYVQDYGAYIFFDLFPKDKRNLGNSVILTPDDYPMFVTFTDLKNARTVKAIAPDKAKIPKHFESIENTFGSGVRIKQVTVDVTDAPVTTEVEKWLPWLPAVEMAYIDGSGDQARAPLGLDSGEFFIRRDRE